MVIVHDWLVCDGLESMPWRIFSNIGRWLPVTVLFPAFSVSLLHHYGCAPDDMGWVLKIALFKHFPISFFGVP